MSDLEDPPVTGATSAQRGEAAKRRQRSRCSEPSRQHCSDCELQDHFPRPTAPRSRPLATRRVRTRRARSSSRSSVASARRCSRSCSACHSRGWFHARQSQDGRYVAKSACCRWCCPSRRWGRLAVCVRSHRRPIGRFLYRAFRRQLTSSPAGVLMAETSVEIPFLIITVESGL